MNKILSAFEAVSQIKPFDVVAINGFGSIDHSEQFEIALAEIFEKFYSPLNPMLIHEAEQSAAQVCRQTNRLTEEGLVLKVISGHFRSTNKIYYIQCCATNYCIFKRHYS